MKFSYLHAICLAALGLGVSCLANSPCDEIHMLVAAHEFQVEESKFEARLNPDGDLVVVLGERVAEVWLPREDATHEVPTPYQSPRAGSATFTLDGRRLLFLSEDAGLWKMHDWNLASGRESQSDNWHPSDGIPYLIHDRLALVTLPAGSARDGEMRLLQFWNPMSGSRLRPLQHMAPGRVEQVTLSPHQEIVAIRFQSPELKGRLVSVSTGDTILDIPAGWTSFAFSPNGKMFAQARNRTIFWRSAETGVVEGRIHLHGPGSEPRDLIFVDEVGLLSVDGGKLIQWELDPAKMRGESNPRASLKMETHGSQFVRSTLSPNKKLLATSFSTGEVILWDRKTWLPIAELVGHDREVHTIQFSEDGSTVLTSDSLGALRLWDLDPKVKPREGTRWQTSRGWLTITRDQGAEQTRIRIDRNLSL